MHACMHACMYVCMYVYIYMGVLPHREHFVGYSDKELNASRRQGASVPKALPLQNLAAVI